MSVQGIIDYLLKTPHNTNPSIVKQKIEETIDSATNICLVNSIKKTNYFYILEYSSWDYDVGMRAAAKSRMPIGCTACRKGDIYGRGLDWEYGNYAEFAVKTKRYADRYSSVSMCMHQTLSEEMADSQKYFDIYQELPFFALDGVNENGVYCNINVVPFGDKGVTTGTHPGKKDLSMLMVVRVILDYAESARHAITLLDEYNIYAPAAKKEECHFMICDTNATYVVEFVNNTMHVLSDQDDEFDNIPNANIMTNFYLSGWNGQIKSKTLNASYTDEEIIATGLTPHGAGYERYNIIANGLNNVEDADDMLDLMKQVQYTKMYDSTVAPFWYSEYTGIIDGYKDLTYLSPVADFAPVIAVAQENYATRTRADGKGTWQTVHLSIYDLTEKKLNVWVQEDYTTKYTIEL